jgi:phosphoadenosine phosphosulfate reductase
MLFEKTLFGNIDKIKTAIQFLKDLEPKGGYYLAFSGGKDSIVIKTLAELSNIKYTAYYNVTTIDPPELIYFIKKYHKDVIWNHPEKPLLKKMIEKKFPPLRMQRWCCELYKENGGSGRRIITGIRKAESAKRAKRKSVEFCFRDKSKQYINPILHWSDSDVWDFIKKYKLPYCKLYDEGWKRIGCLFCPMAGKQRLIEARKYPKYVNLFIKAFSDLFEYRKIHGMNLRNWKSGKDFFYWWLNENKTNKSDQNVLFE